MDKLTGYQGLYAAERALNAKLLSVLEEFALAFSADHIKGHSGDDCFHCRAEHVMREARVRRAG